MAWDPSALQSLTNIVQSVAAVIQAVLALAAIALTVMIWLVYRQQRDIMRRQNRDQNLLAVTMYLQNEEQREARRKLLKWEGTEEEKVASQVAAALNLCAVFAERGLIERGVLINLWGETITRCFQACPPEIQNRRVWRALKDLVSDIRQKTVTAA